MSERKDNSFSRMYVAPLPGETCDAEFARLFEINFGGSLRGAQRHFELLQRIPVGYEYFGHLPTSSALERV